MTFCWRRSHRLRNSDTPLVQIAEEVGYESEAAFNRAFKREFGLPPGRYRTDHKQTSSAKAAVEVAPRSA